MIALARPLLATSLGVAVMFAGYHYEAPSAGADALGPGTVTVGIGIHHSRFDPDELVVREGTLVRFVIRNDDPIRHEFVLGPPEVHARHAAGTEALHPPVPGEVSLDPGETAETIYVFDAPGDLEYMCHLPGHAQYGMRGTVHVQAA